MRVQSAITLVEMLIALAIVSILAGLSLPLLTHFFTRTQDNIIQKQLLHALNFASVQAQVLQTTITLCPSSDQRTCAATWRDHLLIFTQAQRLMVLPLPSTMGKLLWRGFPHNQSQLHFSPQTLWNRHNGTFTYYPVNTVQPSWSIVVNQAGRARVK